MKSAIILSIFAVLCVNIGDAAINPGGDAISRLKTSVLSITDDLPRYVNRLSLNLDTQLSNLKFNHIKNINEIDTSAINSIRNLISAANAKGKNAEHCFEPARLRLRDVTINANKELDACAETGKSSINPVNSNVEALVSLGKRTINDLDAVVISCYSSNMMQMQSCIIGKIPAARATVQALQNSANELKRTGDALSRSAVTTAFRCNLQVEPKMRQEVTLVRAETTKCIDNA